MKKHIAIYVCVSSVNQNTESQEPDLKAWLKVHGKKRAVIWYRDRQTGKTLNRPGVRKLEAAIAAGQVDSLVVWRLDRLGRTAVQMLSFLEQLDISGVRFISIKDGLDTSTAAGRLLRTVLAGVAQYEREVISERIRAGIQKAKADGKRWGGKKPGQRHKLTPQKLSAIRVMLNDGQKKTVIARELGIDRASVYRALDLI